MSGIIRVLAKQLSPWAALLAVNVLLAACDESATGPARVVATVVVSPVDRALVAGEQLQYGAQALDAEGRELTDRVVTWSSDNSAIATVSTTGLVSALIPGATVIRATIDGTVGVGTVHVSPVPVAAVTLDAVQVTLAEGETRLLVATATDAQGNVLAGRPIAWQVDDATIAQVSANGTVTALAAGQTVVRATSEGKSAAATLAVGPAPIASVEPTDRSVTLEEGDARVLAATAKDAAGRVLAGRVFSWTSEDVAVATVDATGRVTAIGRGRANIRVSAEGRTALVDVHVTEARAASVAISPFNGSIEIGERVPLQAIVRDARGHTLPGRTVQWSVTGGNATIAATGTLTGMLTGLRNGPITVTATVDTVSTSIAANVTLAAAYAWDLLYHRNTNGVQEIFTQQLGTAAAPVRINAGAVSRTPTATPNGLRIAFAVSMLELGTGRPIDDIFAVDRNGLNPKQLTTAPGYEYAPSWSPNGARIAYVHADTSGRTGIWVMNADGSNQVNLTADLPATVYPASPAWSPDGTRIVFSQSSSDQAGTTARIVTMRADGTDKREITSTLTGFDSAPTWSADGARIAFMRYFSGDADIAIVGATGGVVTRIAMNGLQSNPSWSPDGMFIVFQQTDGPLTNLYTMRPDGSSVRLRTVDPTWGGGLRPSWIRRN